MKKVFKYIPLLPGNTGFVKKYYFIAAPTGLEKSCDLKTQAYDCS